ncbi:hypothetical protein [Pseudoalteromonas sp. 2CM32C]|uniref:hypothetical protein n=1 Tax=Pseudoalteromonas sp. 2CM32C TaxID=2929852 RepID=UPI0020BE8091|nr:hypothetical protein [Pseudoalteromonas sp. 2CM32C]MCK8121743.1 hypothetical protein [Pseudoalteromonas sp. 2CM32C]
MDIYHGDVVSAIFLILGMIVLFKKKINLTLSAGTSGTNTFVIENSKYTKSKDVELIGFSKALLGILLIVVGVLIAYYFKGDLLFSI